MRPMTLAASVILCALATIGGATEYRQTATAVVLGGGRTTSATMAVEAAIEDAVSGRCSSPDYRLQAGHLHVRRRPEEWLWAVRLPEPAVVGRGGLAQVRWQSGRDGTYRVQTGNQLQDTGQASAGPGESSLPDYVLTKGLASVLMEFASGSETRGLRYDFVHDDESPELRQVDLRQLVCSVDDELAAASSRLVRLSLSGGSTAHVDPSASPVVPLPAGTTWAVLEMENRFGRTTRRRVDLVPGAGEVGTGLLGRTVLLDPTGEFELVIDVTGVESGSSGSARLRGRVTVRQRGSTTATVVPFRESSSGKPKSKLAGPKSDGSRKLKLKASTPSGVYPQIKLELSGKVQDDRVVEVKLSIKARPSRDSSKTRRKAKGYSFELLADAGCPVRVIGLQAGGLLVDDRSVVSRIAGRNLTSGAPLQGESPIEFLARLEPVTGRVGIFEAELTASDDATPPNEAADLRIRTRIRADGP